MKLSSLSRRVALVLIVAGSAGAVTPLQAADSPAPKAEPRDFKTPVLNRAQIDALLAKPAQVLVLDVRRPDELQSKGAFPVFLSIQATDIEKNLAFIPKERQILTVSNHANRAGRTADVLASHGFRIAGAAGVQTYEAEGGKLNKIAPPPPKP